MSTTTAQNGSRAAGSSDGTKTYFTSILHNVVTFTQRKRRKYARKCIHRTAHARVEAACLYD